MRDALAEYDHPAWWTVAGTAAGWLLMLLLVLVILFAVPLLLWP